MPSDGKWMFFLGSRKPRGFIPAFWELVGGHRRSTNPGAAGEPKQKSNWRENPGFSSSVNGEPWTGAPFCFLTPNGIFTDKPTIWPGWGPRAISSMELKILQTIWTRDKSFSLGQKEMQFLSPYYFAKRKGWENKDRGRKEDCAINTGIWKRLLVCANHSVPSVKRVNDIWQLLECLVQVLAPIQLPANEHVLWEEAIDGSTIWVPDTHMRGLHWLLRVLIILAWSSPGLLFHAFEEWVSWWKVSFSFLICFILKSELCGTFSYRVGFPPPKLPAPIRFSPFYYSPS